MWTENGASGPLICVTGERPHIARRVADFLKREARKDIEAAVARHAERLGVSPRRIALRDTASRWGSCSSTGRLNFSWRLILAPPEMLDYLAAHEVAHIVHMNHSPVFWKLTRRLFPETERAEAWLRRHGAGLHRFGASDGLSAASLEAVDRLEQQGEVLRSRQPMVAVLDQGQRHGIAGHVLDQRQRVAIGNVFVAHALQNPRGAMAAHGPPSSRWRRPSSMSSRVKR